jgi:hypothetical protein
MSIDSPLHVQVAEALGWTEISEDGEKWWGREPYGKIRMTIPRYDTSWCSAGAILERFKFGIMWDHGQWIAQYMTDEGHDQYQGGEKPTEAISRLVVHLYKEGKLKI